MFRKIPDTLRRRRHRRTRTGGELRITRITIIVATELVLGATTVCADEVSDAIGQANAAYGSENYKEASAQLQTALMGVNQMLIGMVVDALPDAPGGWTADEPEGLDAIAMGAGMFASLVVTRNYYPPSSSKISVTITANSPLLATFRMFISNPMLAGMAGQGGMKKVSTCGYDGLEQFGDGSFDLNILAGSATLISVSGREEGDIDSIRELANLIECRTIVEIVE
ncbi:hypothetical protein K8S17_05830 [bacterium]|nr:hypothetical protein [bacterium]